MTRRSTQVATLILGVLLGTPLAAQEPVPLRELGPVVRARVNVVGLPDTTWFEGSPVTTPDSCTMIRLDHIGWWERRLVIVADLPDDERVQVSVHLVRRLQVRVTEGPDPEWRDADLPWLRGREPALCRIRARAGGS